MLQTFLQQQGVQIHGPKPSGGAGGKGFNAHDSLGAEPEMDPTSTIPAAEDSTTEPSAGSYTDTEAPHAQNNGGWAVKI